MTTIPDEYKKFKTGDVVTLKSGGIPMTIFAFQYPNINCIWHDVNGQQQMKGYLYECLVLYDELPKHFRRTY